MLRMTRFAPGKTVRMAHPASGLIIIAYLRRNIAIQRHRLNKLANEPAT